MARQMKRPIILRVNISVPLVLIFLLLSPFYEIYSQTTDTVRVYFDLNKTSISGNEAVKINSSVSKNNNIPGTSYMIFGYADNLGGESHNNTLSEQRANNVSDYLVSLGIQKEVISLIEGKGEVKKQKAGKGGYPEDRRVDIVILKPAVTPVENKPQITEPEKPVFVKYPIGTASPGQTFVLKNVFFYPNRHTVIKESLPELDELYQELVDHPTVKIKIEGHVCCIHPNEDPGSVSFKHTQYDAKDMEAQYISPADFAKDSIHYNPDALSINRAKFIYYYLVQKGIPEDRLSYRGFGNMRPIVKNEQTKEDQQLNRRVEVRIVED
jgi:outer membrane protein OmpA-like peptidoglycan-associated protein